MNISDLTPQKLKRATLIKEKLDDLNKELRRLLDSNTTDGAISEKKRHDRGGEEKNCGCAAGELGEA